MSAPKGIDCSAYQPVIDWPALPAQGYQFAMVKATEGVGYRNPDFTAQWAGAWDAGLLRGAYHFGHPSTPVEQAVIEFLGYVLFRGSGQRHPDCFALDLEVTDGLPPAEVAAWGRAFLNGVQWLTGASPFLYSYPAFIEAGNCAGMGSYPLWIAGPGDPAAPVPSPWRSWTLWQQGAAAGGKLGDLDVADTGDLAGLWAALGSRIVKAPG